MPWTASTYEASNRKSSFLGETNCQKHLHSRKSSMQDHLQTENIPACIAGFASLAIMTAAILTLSP